MIRNVKRAHIDELRRKNINEEILFQPAFLSRLNKWTVGGGLESTLK